MNINEFPGNGPERVPDPTPILKRPYIVRTDSGPGQGVGQPGNVPFTELVRDPEVLKLVRSLSQSPDVREDRVTEVQQKLDSGEFLTRKAAEATADALLR